MSGMSTGDMMKVGAVMNIICICVAVLAVNTYGVYMFNMNQFPDWARTAAEIGCNKTMA